MNMLKSCQSFSRRIQERAATVDGNPEHRKQPKKQTEKENKMLNLDPRIQHTAPKNEHVF